MAFFKCDQCGRLNRDQDLVQRGFLCEMCGGTITLPMVLPVPREGLPAGASGPQAQGPDVTPEQENLLIQLASLCTLLGVGMLVSVLLLLIQLVGLIVGTAGRVPLFGGAIFAGLNGWFLLSIGSGFRKASVARQDTLGAVMNALRVLRNWFLFQAVLAVFAAALIVLTG